MARRNPSNCKINEKSDTGVSGGEGVKAKIFFIIRKSALGIGEWEKIWWKRKAVQGFLAREMKLCAGVQREE